jgi:endoglucanase
MKTLCRVAALTLLAALAVASPASAASTTVQGESMTGGNTFSDAKASGGKGLVLPSPRTASATVTTVAAAQLVVVARGDQCKGAPRMRIDVDGAEVLSRDVVNTTWNNTNVPTAILAGSHKISVTFLNDYKASGCDRNLRVDFIRVESIDTAATNPLQGQSLWVDPNSNAAKTATLWRTLNPLGAARLDVLAGRSQADWFGDFSGNIQSAVDAKVAAAAAAGKTPTLVAYNIPLRDCGSYSGGGATSADAYKAWIRSFAAGIGSRKAIVILEPDALAMLDCIPADQRDVRMDLIADAVNVLSARSTTSVYIDIGHSAWLPSDQAAGRLWRSGVAKARGFSLNVSNFRATSELVAYGKDVSDRLGGKGYVIDTSRNGAGPTPDGSWCNPWTARIGAAPAIAPGNGPDANLYVKRVGESDGPCNGGPSAGVWWPEAAAGMVSDLIPSL